MYPLRGSTVLAHTWRYMQASYVAVHVGTLHHPCRVLLIKHRPEDNQRPKHAQEGEQLPQREKDRPSRKHWHLLGQ